jgi:hypothetical protein
LTLSAIVASGRSSSAPSTTRASPVEGLGPDAFVVKEDGVRREVLRVAPATEPMDIAILVDNSTAAADEITFLRSRPVEVRPDHGDGQQQVAFITLADRPTIKVEYTDDAVRLKEAVSASSRRRKAA